MAAVSRSAAFMNDKKTETCLGAKHLPTANSGLLFFVSSAANKRADVQAAGRQAPTPSFLPALPRRFLHTPDELPATYVEAHQQPQPKRSHGGGGWLSRVVRSPPASFTTASLFIAQQCLDVDY